MPVRLIKAMESPLLFLSCSWSLIDLAARAVRHSPERSRAILDMVLSRDSIWHDPAKSNEPPTYLYRYYDADSSLLYVGITSDPRRRDAEHASKSPWHKLAVDRASNRFEWRVKAARRESEIIRALSPTFNISEAGTPSEVRERMAEYAVRAATGGAT